MTQSPSNSRLGNDAPSLCSRRPAFPRRAILRIALALFAVGAPMSWPDVSNAQVAKGETIKIIVPYSPGAATDALGRLMAQALEESLGASVIVDNRGGGGSQIGTQAVATAEPDGTTLGFIDTAFAINPGLFGDKLPYDTLTSFTPLSLMATAQLVLVAHPSVGVDTMAKLLERAKADPGILTYGSAGLGSAPHLAGEQLANAAGIDIIHVPYPGGGSVISDLLGGNVNLAFTTVPTMRENILNGAVKALAVTGETRSPLLPDVPSTTEVGLPTVDASPFFGLIGPAGLAPETVAQLSEAASAVVRDGPLRGRVEELGFNPVGNTSVEFASWLKAEVEKWRKLIEANGITIAN